MASQGLTELNEAIAKSGMSFEDFSQGMTELFGRTPPLPHSPTPPPTRRQRASAFLGDLVDEIFADGIMLIVLCRTVAAALFLLAIALSASAHS
jgi:hypothetical protein